jgi:hypothetical protein
VVLFLTFGLALLPGVAAVLFWRGPRAGAEPPFGPPDPSLQEAAVLRDGAVGATRWAFAALLIKLARDGHCTLVRTRKWQWLRTGPALTVDLHADPTALSSFEQTALRQLGRHDTLGGFGFAGSTFRRRTLRDVRADLVDRGGLADRRRRSNACLALGVTLLAAGSVGLIGGLSTLASAASAGLGVGGLLAAGVRYPVTETGARHRAVHRAYAERQRERIRERLPDHSEEAAAILVEALPALVLERIATPRWLDAGTDRFDTTGARSAPDWIRDEVDDLDSFADACRVLGDGLRAVGARTPIAKRLSPGQP